MRIIAGEFRRRLLATPRDAEKTRPIPDRVKESVFGILRGHCEGAAVFDGFAGTGAIGLEAVSRGAARCVFVERDREIAAILKQNIEALGVEDRCELIIGDALGAGALARCPRPVRLVFLDPPYPIMREPVGFRRVMDQLESLVALLADDGFAVLRTPWPVLHFIPDDPNAAPGTIGPPGALARIADPRPRKKDKRSRKKSQRRKSEWFDEAAPVGEESDEPLDATGPEPDSERADLAAVDDATSGKWVEASLVIPNGKGPETHSYHAMAMHLYAKK